MSFLDNVICPVSNVKVDSHVSRLTVFLNAVFIALYVITGNPLFMAVVALDYGIRVFASAKYSPLKWVATGIARAIGMSEKMVDQAPKMFAARVGFLFALVSVLLAPQAAFASLVVAGTLLVFTILDSVFDFCVGCLTYNYLVLPFYQWRGVR